MCTYKTIFVVPFAYFLFQCLHSVSHSFINHVKQPNLESACSPYMYIWYRPFSVPTELYDYWMCNTLLLQCLMKQFPVYETAFLALMVEFLSALKLSDYNGLWPGSLPNWWFVLSNTLYFHAIACELFWLGDDHYVHTCIYTSYASLVFIHVLHVHTYIHCIWLVSG